MLPRSLPVFHRCAVSGPGHPQSAQRGVVLIISLIMLVVISLLATLSIRNAVSTESVSGNVRTTQLSTQAAEIALRYCEEATVQIVFGTGSLTALPTIQNFATPQLWQNTANWDSVGSVAFVLPAASVNETSGTTTFKRPPECMVERMQVVASGGAVSTATTFIITARGFGPEVAAADSARSRPAGGEAWLQSTIELE